MSAEIVPFPERPQGNGAREALVAIAETMENPECWADHVLIELWMLGFKIVPAEPLDV